MMSDFCLTAEQRANLPLPVSANQVMLCQSIGFEHLHTLFGRFGLQVQQVAPNQPIIGSFWGGSEAGLVADRLYLRGDTPVHSALHEACHYICMDDSRRQQLHTDAGGDCNEENAVCYLQILLADHLPHMGRQRIWADMDAWGYTFRLGSSQAWFEHDADDARQWLQQHALISANGEVTWQRR